MGMKIKVRSRPMLRGLQSLRSEVVLNVVRRSSSGILSPLQLLMHHWVVCRERVVQSFLNTWILWPDWLLLEFPLTHCIAALTILSVFIT